MALNKTPVQVPAIEICFMSIDEIARIFSKCHNPYIGEEIRIFLYPKAYIEGERSEFLKSQGLYRGGEFGIFPSPRA